MLRCCRSLLLLLLLALLLPADSGSAQSRAPFYFRATGHHLSDAYGFLSFWETHGAEAILGLPITEPFEQEGRVVQYLERARLEYHPELGQILLGRLGAERTRWRDFAAAPPTLPNAETLIFSETNHTLAPPFRAFWEAGGGLGIFGFPISEPLWESTGAGFSRVQYFERARLEYHPAFAEPEQAVRVSTLGVDMALAQGLDLAPVAARPDAIAIGAARPAPSSYRSQTLAAPAPVQPVVQERSQQPAAQPTATIAAPPPAATQPPKPAPTRQPQQSGGKKRIEINLTSQWLYAYEGEQLVYDAPVATGKDGFNTPAGTFSIYAKVPLQTMDGTLNGESWSVPNVPHAMYFNGDVGLHGTYWHNLFGTGVRISHGCVNLPLKDAAWLYEWAPIGTTVVVHH